MAVTDIDEAKLEAFVGHVATELGAAVNAALVLIGDELGLFRAMADGQPVSPEELAARTGTQERYVREWLVNQASGGYVEYDPQTARFSLSPEQAAALAAGELDFGLLLPPVSGAEPLEHIVVQRERFVAALPSSHRLATGRGKLAVNALAGEPFVMVPRDIAPGLYDIVTGLAARAGISFNVAQEAIQMQTVVSLVSSGLGVAIVPGCIANLGRRGVVYREIADRHPRLDVWLAWSRAGLGTAARDFLALARRRAR